MLEPKYKTLFDKGSWSVVAHFFRYDKRGKGFPVKNAKDFHAKDCLELQNE